MEEKKYEILTDVTIEYGGRVLYKIMAVKDFDGVKKGDLGGWIEKEFNLSQDDECWIYDEAKAMDNSRVCDNAKMYGYSEMHDNSCMYDNAQMWRNTEMHGNSKMYDNAQMFGHSKMRNNSRMFGDSRMCDNAILKENQTLYGKLYSKVDDYLEIHNPQGRIVTCILKEGKILYNVGCQEEITEEEFKDRIYNEDGGLEKNPHRDKYLKIIELSKMYFKDKIVERE